VNLRNYLLKYKFLQKGAFYEKKQIIDFGVDSPDVGWRTRVGKLRCRMSR